MSASAHNKLTLIVLRYAESMIDVEGCGGRGAGTGIEREPRPGACDA